MLSRRTRLRWPRARWLTGQTARCSDRSQSVRWKRVVEHVERVEVVGVAGALLRAQVVLQRGDVVLGGELGGAADARALERLADELRVGHRGRRDAGHERAQLRHDLDQPLVAQAHERLADRGPAHAEPGGQLVLRELPAGLQLRADDRLAQRGVRLDPGRRRGVLAQQRAVEPVHALNTCIQAWRPALRSATARSPRRRRRRSRRAARAGESRLPIRAPSWPPAADPTASRSAGSHATVAKNRKTTAATPLTMPVRTFLSALSRCRSSGIAIAVERQHDDRPAPRRSSRRRSRPRTRRSTSAGPPCGRTGLAPLGQQRA